MKVTISWDDRYPVYEVDTKGRGIEVDASFWEIARWKRIAKKFYLTQDEMHKKITKKELT